MSNYEVFRKTYTALLIEAVNKDPDGYMYDASEAPAVADKMLIAIQKGSASNSNTLKRVAKKLGIEPTMAAMRVYLKAGKPEPDDKPDEAGITRVMTLVLPAVLQAAGSRTGVYKLAEAVSPDEQKHVAVLVKMLARKWPAFYIRFNKDGSAIEVPRIIGLNTASIKAVLKSASAGADTASAKFSKPVIAYHGTDARNLRSILKKGLLPDQPVSDITGKGKRKAKNIVGTVEHRSWLPHSGVYFTRDIVNGVVNAQTFKKPLLIIAQVQIKDSLPDEDLIKVPNSDSLLSQVLAYRLDIDSAKDSKTLKLRDAFLKSIDPDYKRRKNLQELQELALEVMLREWERNIAQAAAKNKTTLKWLVSSYHKLSGNHEPMPVNVRPMPVALAEQRLRESLASLLGKLKTHVDMPHWKGSFRLTKPIAFSGANKILAIIELTSNRKRIILHFGSLPKKFFDDYKDATFGVVPDVVKPKPAKPVMVPDVAAKAKSETKEPGYTVNKARYAKGMMAVCCEKESGWKTRAMRLAEYFSRNRYSGRENAYIMSPSAASKFEKAFKDGYGASYMSRELRPPLAD